MKDLISCFSSGMEHSGLFYDEDDNVNEVSSSESEEEFQPPNFNILNNSLVQIYRTDREINNGTLVPVKASDGHTEDPIAVSSLLSCDCHMSSNETTLHSDSVGPLPQPQPLLFNPLPETDKSAESALLPPAAPQKCDDEIPVATLEEGSSAEQSSTKKVSFSTPEVTGQHDYLAEEEGKMRKVKKRKNRRREEEGSKVKRMKTDKEASSDVKQVKSSGESVAMNNQITIANIYCFCAIVEFLVQSSAVRFSDVGGCRDCLKEVSRLLLHMRHPELFARLRVRPPQGFLLHGPPGCGKTLIANAIAGVSMTLLINACSLCTVAGVGPAFDQAGSH